MRFVCNLIGMSALALGTASVSGSTWIEQGDAGQSITTPQITVGVGPLWDLCGKLDTKNDIDIFCINVLDVIEFTATTSAPFDTQLFLFTLSGIGISASDNISGSNNQSRITGQFVPGPGLYLLAIGKYNNDPLTSTNQLIWNNTPRNSERAPDGPGAAGALDHWNNGASGGGGDYKIDFKGTGFHIPAPGTAALLGLAGLITGRRRR